MTEEPRFRMTIDLNVLDHLADGLYSSVAAVLTEAVANAWDADAQSVWITLDIPNDRISIIDDGIGMDDDAINSRYLRVGYRRRAEGNTSPGGRVVMGRKGIGKLSLFSISDLIEVHTQAEDAEPVGLQIDAGLLRQAMEEERADYNPEPVPFVEDELAQGHGTRLVMTRLKRGRLREVASESLRRRLARRFSVIGSESFRVFVDDVEVTAADRQDLKFVEYLWVFGDGLIDTSGCTRLKETKRISGEFSETEPAWQAQGWIGTVDRPKSLATPEGNLNSIVLLSRGRLVDEDVLPRIAGAEMYTKYLTGQVEADFLDDTQVADIVTSNRQSVIEDDERVVTLITFLRRAMREIADAWSGLRATDKTSELRGTFPRVGDWLDDLPAGWKAKAEKLLERIATMEIGGDDQDQDESRRTLLRHAVFGFERLRLRGDAEELEIALAAGVDTLLKILADRDSLEASFYRDIVTNRLSIIEELQRLVDGNQRERVLQKYLFGHLWLLDASWERATGSEEMERQLRLYDAFEDSEETKDKYGRVDIRYRTIAGKHVIVELKRASVRADLYDLAKQGAKYVDAVRDLLAPEEKDRANIEVVFVVGPPPTEPSERVENAMNSVAPGSRIVTYDLLIARSREAYASYLEGSREADRIDRLFDE